MRFYYSYDASGVLYGVKYILPGSTTVNSRYYTHNIFGDIIGIYEGGGALQAKYTYDAWGNVTSIVDGNGNTITDPNHIGNLNPFRYRGYYLDMETGLYYLMSRYYDPVVHRFINADGYFQAGGDILEANMSAYCSNNPVSLIDIYGNRNCEAISVNKETYDNRKISCQYQCKAVAQPMGVGSAPYYIEFECGISPDTSPNCYSYAIGKYDRTYQPGDFSNTSHRLSVESVYRSVYYDMEELGRSCRRLDSYNSPICDYEYRVALKVSSEVDEPYAWDYHFMVQTRTGQWAEKHGYGGKTVLHDFGKNPSNLVWTDGESKNEKYASDLIYFAISK